MNRNTSARLVSLLVSASGLIAIEAGADVTFYQYDEARFRILGYFDADGNTLPGQPAEMFVTHRAGVVKKGGRTEGAGTAEADWSTRVFGKPLGKVNSRLVLSTWAEGRAPSGGSYAAANIETEAVITFMNTSTRSFTVMWAAGTYSFNRVRGGDPLLESGHAEGWADVNADGLWTSSHTHTDYVPGGYASDPSGAHRGAFSVPPNGGVLRVKLFAESEGWGRTFAAPAPGTLALSVLGIGVASWRRRG